MAPHDAQTRPYSKENFGLDSWELGRQSSQSHTASAREPNWGMAANTHRRPWTEYCYTPFTRYNRLSNRLYDRFNNRLCRVNKHPTGCEKGCQTGLTTSLTTVLNEQPLFVQPVVKPHCNRIDNRLYTRHIHYVCIHDTTGCQTGMTTGLTTGLTTGCRGLSYIQAFTRLSYRFDNRIDNRFYRAKGALEEKGFKQPSRTGVTQTYTLNADVRETIHFLTGNNKVLD